MLMGDVAVEVTVAARPHSVRQPWARHGTPVHFKDVCVNVKNATDKQPLKLLDGVSGSLMAGQMTALMGSSGSGKTTLLDVLSGRKTTGCISGTILYGASAPSKAYLRAATGYVEQYTTLIPVFTPYEMLLYTAELKRSWQEPRASKVAVVEALLNDLQLQPCAHVVIGDPMTKGISGGQAKRVSIGVAMVCVPPVLYLDEPTSGLDSHSAYEIINLVRKKAVDGVTVAVAIHSPGPEVFNLFESVIALAGGHIVFSGGTGDCYMNSFKVCAQPWLEGMTDTTAFADILIQAASTAASRGDTLQLCKAAEGLLSGGVKPEAPQEALPEFKGKGPQSPEPVQGQSLSQAQNPSLFHLYLLLKYRASRNWTSAVWFGGRLVDKMFMCLIMVTLFYGQGERLVPAYLVNLTAGLYMCVAVPAFSSWGYTSVLIHDRALYYREVADGLYGPFAYLTYKILEEVLALVPISLGLTPIVFYVVKYQGSFVLFWLVYIITYTTSINLAYTVSSFSKTVDLSNILATLYILACFFSAGQIATLSTLPIYWTWISRVNFVRYAWSALMLNQFGSSDPGFTTDDQTVLQYYGISGDVWMNLGLVCVFMAVFHVLAWLALTFVNHQRR